jgi:6-phosphogluconolactonase (cycloisomerase 2 family)
MGMNFNATSNSRSSRVAYLATSAVALVLLTAQTGFANSGGRVNFSGNPDINGGLTCNECHTGGVFGDPEFVRIKGRGTLLSGVTGNFSVDIDSDTNRNKCGVGISATAGQLIASDSDTRIAANSLGEDEVVNDGAITSCGGIGFQWTAPLVQEPTTALFYVGGIISAGSGQTDDPTGTALYSVTVLPSVDRRELITFQSVLDSGSGADVLGDPTEMIFGPGDSELYVTSKGNSAIVAFDVDPASGALTHVQTVEDGVGGVDGFRSPAGLAITNDGTRLFSVSASDDRVPVFDRAANGDISFVSDESAANRRDATDIILSPDGQVLYTASEDRSGGFQAGVAVFALDTGLPVSIQTLNAGFGIPSSSFTDSPQALVASPDSEFLYVSGFDPAGVFVLKRNDGELTLGNPIQHLRDDVGGAHGIGGPRSIAISPDGHYLYSTDRTADSLVVFERDTVTGLLTFLQALKRNDDIVDGLQDPSDIHVSNSGRFVYVSSNGTESSLAVFERGFASGFLVPADTVFQTDPGFEALDGAAKIAINSTGTKLYVASDGSGSAGTILVLPEPSGFASSAIACLSVLSVLRTRSRRGY